VSNTITISEPQVNTVMTTWTGLQLERGSIQAGPFTLVTQMPYVANQSVYTYTDTVGAITDWYRVTRYAPGPTIGPYSPPWTITSPPFARRSQANCRQMLANRLHSLELVRTTSPGATDGSTLVARQLAGAGDNNRYRGWWALASDQLAPSALQGEVRKIGDQALSVGDGTLNFATVKWPAQVPAGLQVEFHNLLPPLGNLHGMQGLRECLNAALRECYVPDRLLLAGSTSSAIYDLASFGSWLEPEAIKEMWYPLSGGTMPSFSGGGFSSWRAGSTLDLAVIGLPTGQNSQIEVTRQGDTLIKTNGVWTDNSSGFVNDLDECLFQPEFLTEIAMVHALGALASSAAGSDHSEWAARADDQRRYANILKLRYLTHVDERMSHPVGSIGMGADWPLLVR
jgi:hypothetical protein